ncbi:hypothetical protein EV144_101960 [Flavobacterium sp. 270]|uniref:hypothetical protein n=1 Tax=Flavobacterium sp. 270 TaxID=2512114 RepID=UPI001066BCDE|nr:hypothetical protein [Flavobacterium sp. 270]TDW52271.1 hypothetical protein EV144_101960 [Flavobacterium sp. 270]
MIIFRISEDVERNIKKINPNGRIIGDWTGRIVIKEKEDLTSFAVVNLLKKMLTISGRPSKLLMSDMKRVKTNDYATWVADTEDFDSWLDNLQVIDNSIESTLANYYFDLCLEGKEKHVIKDGATFLLAADDYPTSSISLSLWLKINVFSELIWAGFNEESNQPNKLLLGKECAEHNRNVLSGIIEQIKKDFRIEQPFIFESENMNGICATGFKNDCNQFRF